MFKFAAIDLAIASLSAPIAPLDVEVQFVRQSSGVDLRAQVVVFQVAHNNSSFTLHIYYSILRRQMQVKISLRRLIAQSLVITSVLTWCRVNRRFGWIPAFGEIRPYAAPGCLRISAPINRAAAWKIMRGQFAAAAGSSQWAVGCRDPAEPSQHAVHLYPTERQPTERKKKTN